MSRGSGRAFPVCPQAEHLLYVAVCGSFLPTFQVLGNSANLSIPVSVTQEVPPSILTLGPSHSYL